MIRKIRNTLSWLIVLLLISPSGSVFAQSENDTDPIVPSPVIITEVQTGSALGSDEFIELYNNSESAVDITGWQLRCSNASTEGDGSTLVAEVGVNGGKTVLEPSSYYVLHTSSVMLAEDVAGQTYTAKLSSADKAIGLFAPRPELCQLIVQDAVAWGASTRGEGLAVVVDGNGDKLLRRNVGPDGKYVDTNNNAYDYVISLAIKSVVSQLAVGATPGSGNMIVQTADQLEQEGTQSSLAPLGITDCEIQDEQTEEPGASEEPEIEQPTEQPPATIEAESAPVATAADGPIMPSRDAGLVAPQITELLPNPKKPQTDADDEYIELYNSNSSAFELSGFVLAAGKKKYVFPDGILLQPRSFTAFFSTDTKLTLSNTQGQVYLLDPFGRQIAQTDSYQKAKDGQAWALANGTWQWTTLPTPNSANVIKSSATKTTATKAKNPSAKASPAKSIATTARKSAQDSAVSAASFNTEKEKPTIHTGVLVMATLFALLYGVYEYRQDLANRIYQLRIHREARREARHDAEGR